jgi:hypothetical protein
MAKSYVEGVPQRGAREEEGSVRFDISPYILALITLVFITKNASATFRLKSRAYEFLQRVDGRMYDDNPTLSWWIALSKNVGESVVKKGARDYPAIRYRALEDSDWEEYHQTFFENYEANAGIAVEGELLDPELSDELVRFADDYVSTRLRYNYIWAAKPVLREIVSRLDANDVGQVSEFGDHVLEALEALCHRGRQAKSVGGVGAVDFRTGDASYEAAVRAAHQAANRPQALVKTGMRLLNDMLGGGYQGGRVYVHFGRSGDFKSGLLCSAAFWACEARFNPSFETKDPTRKPTVLFVTMENDCNETIERMISYALGSNVDLRGSDEGEMVRRLAEAYGSETCDFSFKYRQNRSITTADVDAMIEEEHQEGREVVLLVHDYVKRIKSVETFKDARHLELGAVVDEWSSINHGGLAQ